MPWPTGEDRLSLEQRMELQQDLISLGHLEGEVDGIIGSGTLEGVRSYQRAKGSGGRRLSDADHSEEAAGRGTATTATAVRGASP